MKHFIYYEIDGVGFQKKELPESVLPLNIGDLVSTHRKLYRVERRCFDLDWEECVYQLIPEKRNKELIARKEMVNAPI